ncbi:MAG: ribonuclease E/G [Sphingomonadales bacterium]|nr:ribonuclease E/G [Sphingomonadales bacterium]
MLIDARHREETRVAVLNGNRIEEFDFESSEHKQLKGNIYLAKVTRVEPSLQAAFIEYGGNRHGFLAFSEIHPDYYQIPKEDREALLREEAEHAAEEAAMRAEEDIEELEGEVEDVVPPAPLDEDDHADNNDDGHGDESQDDEERGEDDEDDEARGGRRARNRGRGKGPKRRPSDELKDKRMALRRRYKIQDVIKRRQVMLVQVVKEERGNKGAALTTYLSLAGRYCVLMPNTSHGGGISRKIANGSDRKRLKSIIDDLKLPPSVGVIIRTAGLSRTKPEIKRDFDYLARLWDGIRENTLGQSAPALIHSDSDLIKRAIRDIYNREISEVLVEGEDGYRAAKDFMKLLMPSHAKRVQHYADPVPLFQRYGAEDQLSAMYNPVVQLKSGGYLVINPTEALVSIDINSGRSTKEHGIEATAYSTNIEAAREIARQLRLRDMAGLVVIDFIDMEKNGNVRKVERAMKDALKNDRARIQVGRISGFGLMEMSRQRLRTGVLEASTRECPHCEGTGLVRTASSAALSALRLLEEEAAKGKGTRLVLRTSQEASYYVLNAKRDELAEIEHRYGVVIEILSDGETEGARMTVDISGPRPENMPKFESLAEDDDDVVEADDYGDDGDGDDDADRSDRDDRGSDGKRRRKRGGRGRSRDERGANDQRGGDDSRPARIDRDDSDQDEGESRDRPSAAADEDEGDKPKRRRGRRGGRRRRGGRGEGAEGGEHQAGGNAHDQGGDRAARTSNSGDHAPAPADDAGTGDGAQDDGDDKPRTRRRPRARKPDDAGAATPATAGGGDVADAAPAKAPRKPRARKAKADDQPTAQEPADTPTARGKAEKPAAKPRARAKPAAKPAKAAKAATAKTDAIKDDDAKSDAAPDKAPRKPAAKKPAETAAARPASDVESATEEAGAGGGSRRGWWQRTFGN